MEARARYEQALALYEAQRYSDAVAVLTALDGAFANSQDVLYLKARCLAADGRTYEARMAVHKLQSALGDGPWTELSRDLRGRGDADAPESDEAVGRPDRSDRNRRLALSAVIGIVCLVVAVSVLIRYYAVRPQEQVANIPSEPALEPALKPEPARPVSRAESNVAKSLAVQAPTILKMLEMVEPSEAREEDREALSKFLTILPMAPSGEDTPAAKSILEWTAHLRRVNTRGVAVSALSQLMTVDDLDILNDILERERDPAVRCLAIQLMGHLRSDTSLAPLRKALQEDSSEPVRLSAALAMGRIGSRRAVPWLEEALRTDRSLQVRQRAARALHFILGPDVVPLCQTALSTEKDGDVILALRWFSDVQFKGTTAPAIVPGEASYASYKGTLYKVYVPSTYGTGRCFVLVSVHGSGGTPDGYVDMCRKDAERYGVIVVAPFFDFAAFPDYDTLNIALDETRSDLRLLEILDDVAEHANVDVQRFYLFGHSKGGQFVTRFVWAHAERIIRAAACGSGYYLMPAPKDGNPMGIEPGSLASELAPLDFGRVVTTPLAVIVGTKDLDRRQQAAAEFMKAVNDYARSHQLACNVQFFQVRGGGHSGASNFPMASRFLFDTSTPAGEQLSGVPREVDVE